MRFEDISDYREILWFLRRFDDLYEYDEAIVLSNTADSISLRLDFFDYFTDVQIDRTEKGYKLRSL